MKRWLLAIVGAWTVVLVAPTGALAQASQGVNVTVQQGATPTPESDDDDGQPTASPGPTGSPSPTPTLSGGGGRGATGTGPSVLGSVTSRGGGTGGSGDLPKTGGDIALLFVAGLALLASGTFLIVLARRRRLASDPRS